MDVTKSCPTYEDNGDMYLKSFLSFSLRRTNKKHEKDSENKY